MMIMAFILFFKVTLCSSFLFAQSADPNKSFDIFFDCYTDDHYFDCFKIKESLKINLKYQDKIVPALESSNAVLKFRTREIHEGTVEKIIIEQSFSIQGEERWTVKKPYVESEINDTTLMEVVNQVVNLLGTQRGINSVTVNEKGSMVTEYATNGVDPSSGSKDMKDWYLTPSGSIYFDKTLDQSKDVSVDLSAEYVKSHKKSKVILGAKGFINQKEINLEDGATDNYTEVFLRIKGLYIRTLSNERWSAAIIGKAAHAPQDNLIVNSEIFLGVEYQLVPFITKAEDKTLSIRYVVGPEYYKLEDPNYLDEKDFMLLKHGLEVAGSFNFSKFNNGNQPLSLNVYLGADSEVDNFRYASLYLSTGIDFNITERISLSPHYNISFAKKYPNQPKETTDGGVIDTVKNAGRFGLLRQGFHLRLSVAIGSTGLKNKDKRWQ